MHRPRQTYTDSVNTTDPTELEPPSGASRFGFSLGQVFAGNGMTDVKDVRVTIRG